MSAALTIHEPHRDEQELVAVLQSSLYPGAKPESIALVLAYCRANGLDPMLKPVHIVPTSIKLPNGSYETRDVLMPGIADYRIKASRSGEYGGKSEPEFGPDVTADLGGTQVTYPSWCRVTVRRIVQGQARDFPAVERWLENYATVKRDSAAPNTMWKKRPYGQLAKVAEAQALRMAFPEFSAGYTAEEMQGKTLDTFTGETIDADPPVPLRSAATAMPRGARVTEPAPNGNGRKRTVGEFLASLRLDGQDALREPNPAEAVNRLVCGEEVLRMKAYLKDQPLAELNAIITELLVAITPAAPPDATVPELDVEIAGADKVLAG